MTFQALRPYDARFRFWASLFLALVLCPVSGAFAADEPDLIFRRSTVFKWLTPNDKLATYGVDDPEVEGVACHFTVPERGGVKGWLGVAEEVSDISLACSQIGPIHFRSKLEQGDDSSGSGARCFSRRCRSSAAATPSGTCWSIWCIRTG
jgi:CreA protein